MGIKKHTYEFIKGEIEKEGYKLLSKEYINVHMKLEVECTKGHKYKVRYNNFQQGSRCPYCNGNAKHSYEYIKGQIEKEGYKLLSKEYIGSHKKLEAICDKGHKYFLTWANFQGGQRCSICNGGVKHSYEYIKEQIEKEGYKLLSKEYIDAHIKLEVKCSKGHKYKVVWYSFRAGHRCPLCSNNVSKGEKEVLELIKLLTNELIVENDRTQIINPLTGNNLELDIWIPSLNKAVEYNGLYWHNKSDINIRDQEKIKQCKEKGIDLLIIDDIDWLDNKKYCINKIKQWISYEI